MLDEPTDGLDPNQKHEVRALIRELARERTVLLSTHILEEVEAVCSRAMIVARGRVLADATPAELLARSRFQGAVSLVAVAERLRLRGVEHRGLQPERGRLDEVFRRITAPEASE